mgnify:FL=1
MSESNVVVWLSLSNNPRLPKRIQAVGRFMNVEGTPSYTQAALLFGGIFGVYLLTILLFSAGTIVYAKFIPDFLSEDSQYEEVSGEPAEGETPLMTAVFNGDVEEVKALLKEDPDLEARDAEGYTALSYAVFSGENEIAQVLLDAGADPNAQDDYSNVLVGALYNDNYELASMLYECGADPALEDPSGESGYSILDVDNEEDFLLAIEEE